MFDFASLPVVDNHCHPSLPQTPPDRYAALDTFLGFPGDDPASVAHRDGMLYQGWATRQLAAFLGCEATEGAVAEARAREAADEVGYVGRLFADAKIEALVVDTGYPQPPIDDARYRARTPVPVLPIFRIEPLIRDLLAARLGYDELVRRFDEAIRRAVRDDGYRGPKSIIAYRTGLDLDLDHAPAAAGRRGLDLALAEPERLPAAKPLRDHLLLRALGLSIELAVPFQIHTGFGDADIVLARCNPALLNGTLKEEPYRRARVVLIHCYPYLAEASWMAAALPNVWLDLSLGIPFAPLAADRIVATALELAPIPRILFGCDAASAPEQSWLGAKLAKAALGRVLADAVAKDLLTEGGAHAAAAAILAGNARSLYALG